MKTKNPLGYFSFVLHSHIPYVMSHGRWPHGTDWLNEASAESYIPLLNVLTSILERGGNPSCAVGLTPVLCEQLSSQAFKEEFTAYLENRLEAVRNDRKDFSGSGKTEFNALTAFWERFYENVLRSFRERYSGDIIGGFRRLRDEGSVEILTSAATHGYLPLLGTDEAVKAQILVGKSSYMRHFGEEPKGIWLPECAYRPRYHWTSPVSDKLSFERRGVEEFLGEAHIKFFFVDSHMLKGGKAIGVYLDRFKALKEMWERSILEMVEKPVQERSHLVPYLVSSPSEPHLREPISFFTRDPRTAVQVWSGERGYPGDGNYLEFHKKHFPGGIRYWRVTASKSDLARKETYVPENAFGRIPENAMHFVSLVKEALIGHHKRFGTPGMLCAPYDTELLGHWWFEGVQWFETVLRIIDEDDMIEALSPRRYLEKFPPRTVVSLPEGSWGEGGFHYVWLNSWTEWTWKLIHEAELSMNSISAEARQADRSEFYRVLKQAIRELLLLESSDWQFLISTWSARDYAEGRVERHYEDFTSLIRLLEKLKHGERLSVEEITFLSSVEERDNLFPDIDPLQYSRAP
ncbi:MAG: DUF1957 domain-containing protein [Candidatus Eisenbacteria bacterium]|nr:DUF1957 domain-containing protein [Candidatus Eisenbacteria bacterium]